MAYAFTGGDGGDVEAAVRRIAVERVDDALAALHGSGGPDETVHTVRKRVKQLRAVVRLASASLPHPKRDDRALRDVARALSPARDAKILGDTFAALVADARRPLDVDATYAIRKSLADARGDGDADAGAAREAAAARLSALRERMAGWRLSRRGWKALEGGLCDTYATARTEMKLALKGGNDAAVHEWRKAAKAHFHHLELLRPCWPGGLKPAVKAADRLQETLGDHHDLALLAAYLETEAAQFGGARAAAPFVGLIADRQEALAATAADLGARLFAERPSAFASRVHAYWKAWRRSASVDAARLAA